MITPNMTHQEIAQVFEKEFLGEIKKGYDSCFGQSDRLARMIRKIRTNAFHLLYTHEKKTKQLNDFVVLFFSKSKPIKGQVFVSRTVYMKYHLSDGIHVATAHPKALNEVTSIHHIFSTDIENVD